MFGKKEANESAALARQAAQRYSQMSAGLEAEAGPQRRQVGDYYSGIIKGGPEAMKVAAPEVSFIKRQFANARQQARDYLPRGGAQVRAQQKITMAQPGAIGDALSKKISEALERLTQISQANTQGSFENTGGVSRSSEQIGQIAEQKRATGIGLIGAALSPVGMILGSRAGSAPTRRT